RFAAGEACGDGRPGHVPRRIAPLEVRAAGDTCLVAVRRWTEPWSAAGAASGTEAVTAAATDAAFDGGELRINTRDQEPLQSAIRRSVGDDERDERHGSHRKQQPEP